MADRLAIGIDLGGTQVRAALIAGGTVLNRAATATDVAGGPGAVLQQFHHLIEQICSPNQWTQIAAIGLCAPGPLDSDAGVVIDIPTLPGWDNFPLKSSLCDHFAKPVTLENDGIAAANGEWLYGAGQGLRHFIYVTVSTGIGGGIVADGSLLRGRRGMAGHIGHFRISADGPRCSCKRIGCFEAHASGSALGAKALASAKPQNWLGQQAGAVGARDVFEGAIAGDDTCLALLAEEARLLGRGFASLAHLYSPERIIMGGGVAKGFNLLEQGILAEFEREVMTPFRDVEICPAALGDNSGLIGAAALALAAA